MGFIGLTCREDCIVGRVCSLHHTLQTVQNCITVARNSGNVEGIAHGTAVDAQLPAEESTVLLHRSSSTCYTMAFVLALYMLQADDKHFTPHALFIHQG